MTERIIALRGTALGRLLFEGTMERGSERSRGSESLKVQVTLTLLTRSPLDGSPLSR
jgi:hypothetical protein